MDTRTLSGIRLRGVWFASSLALGLAAACSSSSSGNSSNSDDSGTPDSSAFSPVADAGGTGGFINASCGGLAALGGGEAGTCPSGQTCCMTISLTSLSVSASCVAQDQCSGGISSECTTSADCTGGTVCCTGAAATDASTEAGGGAAGIGGFLAALNTTCQTSCHAGQQQQCASNAECPSGEACQSVSLAGIPGDAGGGNFGGGGDAAAFTLPKICAVPTPDSGVAPELDSGSTPEAGPPAPDAGTDASSAQ